MATRKIFYCCFLRDIGNRQKLRTRVLRTYEGSDRAVQGACSSSGGGGGSGDGGGYVSLGELRERGATGYGSGGGCGEGGGAAYACR